tara:strand:+ start:248 stop:514 length:267 start_codon:yes stop_codon:yes gene_type:complete
MKDLEETKATLESRKQKVIKKIIDLGHPKETAEEMLRVYLEETALAAQKRWPREFGLFTSGTTVLDILAESDVQYLSNQVLWSQENDL